MNGKREVGILIRAKCYIKDINYNSLVDIAMPYITKWLAEKNRILSRPLTNILSKNGKASGVSKFLVSLIPNKENLIASMLPRFDETLVEFLNDMAEENGIVVLVKTIDFIVVKGGNKDMLKIEVTIDNIDYEKTILNLTPSMLLKWSEQDNKSGNLAKLFLQTKDLPSNVLKAAIGAIPLEQRDELLAAILMEYKEELTESLNMMVTNNNIKAEINEISIKNE